LVGKKRGIQTRIRNQKLAQRKEVKFN